MEIERIIYPVETLGPGKRIVIWTIGCSKHCEKCINPELWEKNANHDIPISQIVAQIKHLTIRQCVDGITISGGDPLEQREEFLNLIQALRPLCCDILVYTGYTLDEIDRLWSENERTSLRSNVSVLIDGRYRHELNDNHCPLCGSTNQVIHYFDEECEGIYGKYCNDKGRTLQTFHYSRGSISVGIHNKEENSDGTKL